MDVDYDTRTEGDDASLSSDHSEQQANQQEGQQERPALIPEAMKMTLDEWATRMDALQRQSDRQRETVPPAKGAHNHQEGWKRWMQQQARRQAQHIEEIVKRTKLMEENARMQQQQMQQQRALPPSQDNTQYAEQIRGIVQEVLKQLQQGQQDR